MADAEGQRKLEDLINDANFPMPGPEDLDLDFDYDFETGKIARGAPSTPRDNVLEQQYGAVAALATQGAMVRPVNDASPQPFRQDWQMLPQASSPGGLDYNFSFQSPPAGEVSGHPNDAALGNIAGPSTSNTFGANFFQGFDALDKMSPVDSESNPHPFSEAARAYSKHDSADSSEFRSGELDAQAKAERTKAKNKRAQKKFRMKQKEKHEELERSAAELSTKLNDTLAELDALQSQKRVLEIALSRTSEPQASSSTDAEVSQEPVFVPAQGFERFSSKAGILLEVLFDPPKKLTHEQAIRLSVKDHARLWKEQCRQASELLRSGASDIESPSGKKLRALMNERHGLLAWTSVNNPVIIHKLMTSKLVDPPVPDHEPPGPAFWQRILEAMRLTTEQQTFLLNARREYLQEVGRLLEARKGLQSTLRGLDTGFKTALGDKARTHIQWADAVSALQENVDAFHICHCVFMASVYNYSKGFSVVQEASLMVQSFPHAPDVFALLKQLAAVTGETPFAQQDLSGSNRRHSDNPSGTVKFPAQEYTSLVDKLESAITAVNENFIEKLG